MRRNVYSVGQVNSYIQNMFAQDFMMGHIAVRGEISNCKYHSSLHIYITLKDETGVLKAVMFRGSVDKGLTFHMDVGDRVVVLGEIRIYERDGQYQLYAQQVTRDGVGILYQKFMERKKELEEMGMFAQEYKRDIPRYASRVGIVTAPTGAAIRDILNISHRRNPYVQLLLYPALVQGEGAAASIVQGIYAMEQKNVDVIIVGRGGGSMEDLWAFNEEMVARAIFDSKIPIISAVGHETDFTICDFAELGYTDFSVIKDVELSSLNTNDFFPYFILTDKKIMLFDAEFNNAIVSFDDKIINVHTRKFMALYEKGENPVTSFSNAVDLMRTLTSMHNSSSELSFTPDFCVTPLP